MKLLSCWAWSFLERLCSETLCVVWDVPRSLRRRRLRFGVWFCAGQIERGVPSEEGGAERAEREEPTPVLVPANRPVSAQGWRPLISSPRARLSLSCKGTAD